MRITLLTLFPDFFTTPFASSILARAQAGGAVSFEVINIRDFATDTHRTTDDRPYGGGAGMVLKVEPIARALASIGMYDPGADSQSQRTARAQAGQYIVLTSAKGVLFDQSHARKSAVLKELVIICGHYEGVDERVAQHLIDAELRIGDYVLTGGEPAALVMSDAIARLVPGVLGNSESLEGESHSQPGQLGHPQYTRPAEYNGWQVPEVLLGGDHAAIERWRDESRN